jgi:tRNA nucleotidyltransferase (CCA-adding enzyme)
MMHLPAILFTIADDLEALGGRAIVVGGAVRDHFLGSLIKDWDVEVYGVASIERLSEVLQRYGRVNLVGKSFGVLKFVYEEREYDFSLPRIDKKVGVGHRGFAVEVDGTLSFMEASRRRDFTINAMGYDIKSGRFLDPFGGQEDIEKGVVRYVDRATFVEDPLRLYRGVQFASRFGYRLAKETFDLCWQMVAEGMIAELPKERVMMEWQKLLLKSPKPSVGFELMRSLGVLERYFLELHALIGVPQSPKWHPEGDVWVHTMMSLDAMANLCREGYTQERRLRLLFAILCHDLGKATHTQIDEEGRIRAIGHERAGVEPTQKLLYRLTNEHRFIASLLPLVEHHLKPSQFYHAKSNASAIRRLAMQVDILELVIVAKADFLGRTTHASKEGIYHAGEWLLERSKALQVDKAPLTPLLQGCDLIALGLSPSKAFGQILKRVYEKQVDGEIKSREEAMMFVKQIHL